MPEKPDKPRCTGRSKRTKKPCRNSPMRGSKVCRMHGGGTPQARNKASRRLVEAEARRAFGRLGDVSTPIEDPLTALASLAGHVTAWMEFLAGRIGDLERLAYSGETGEQIKGEIILFERALDRCNTVLATMGRLNIDERLARVSEKQVQLVGDAITAALADLGLNAEQQREARLGVVRHLRLIPG